MEFDDILGRCPVLKPDSLTGDRDSLNLLRCESLDQRSLRNTSVRCHDVTHPTHLNGNPLRLSIKESLESNEGIPIPEMEKQDSCHNRKTNPVGDLLTELPVSRLDPSSLHSDQAVPYLRPIENIEEIPILATEKQVCSETDSNGHKTSSEICSEQEMILTSFNMGSLNTGQTTNNGIEGGLKGCVSLKKESFDDHDDLGATSAFHDHISTYDQSVEESKVPSLAVSSLENSWTDESMVPRIPRLVLQIFGSILSGRRVDLRKLARTMNSLGIVPQDCVTQLEGAGESWNENHVRILIASIDKNVTTLQLVYKMHKTDFAEVAKDLFSFYLPYAEQSRCREVSRKIVGNRKKIQFYFKKIKQDVHKLFTSNPYAEVSLIGKKMLLDIKNESNPGKRRHLYDQYICLKAAEIDAHTNQTDNVDPKGEPFQQIDAIIEESSCPEISLILMLGRQANIASSLGTNPSDGENFLIDAFTWQNTCERCIEATDMIYKSVVFYLLQFQRTKDKDYQKKLFHQAEIGLDSLSEEDDDVRLFWSRLFRLRIIYCHLGIGKRGEIIEGYDVSQESIKIVEKMFQEDNLENLEHRRKMMYGIGAARFCHILGDVRKARDIIDKAMEFAEEGNYSEKGNVSAYRDALLRIDVETVQVVTLSAEYLFHTISPIYSRQTSRSSTNDTQTSDEIIINKSIHFESISSEEPWNYIDSDGPPGIIAFNSSDQVAVLGERRQLAETMTETKTETMNLKVQQSDTGSIPNQSPSEASQSDNIHLQSGVDELSLSSFQY
ncbi:uncharacterized protein LOC125658250 isoform X4 [Ostrea edulis]|nr:uncharacterized protein LOC125658250 isoform X4 [Ostrea edulis]